MIIKTADAQRYWNTAARVSGNGYIALETGAVLRNLSGSFSIECWFNAPAAGNSTIIGRNGVRLVLEQNGANVRGRIQTNNITRLKTKFSTALVPGKWYHLACTYDSTTDAVKLFVNGNLDSSGTTTTGALPGTDSVFMGRSSYGTDPVIIDDIRIWDHERTQQQIRDNMRISYNYPNDPASGLIMQASFDPYNTGPFQELFLFDGYNNYANRGAVAVNIGLKPSVTTISNSALRLDGVGDYAAIRSHPNIELTGTLTLEAWINPDTSDADYKYIIAKKSGSTGYAMYYKEGKVGFFTNNSICPGQTTIPLKKWTHVAITMAGDNSVKIYLNGKYDVGYVNPPFPAANSDSLFIGKFVNTYFKGYIDAVKITNYTKTPEEINKTMFEVVDTTNDPQAPFSTVSINFDIFTTFTNTVINAGSAWLRGDAHLTRPNILANTPLSPIIGGVPNFPDGYKIKASDRRIPEFNTSGFMKEDTLNFPSNMLITDLNFFIALNHDNQSDMKIYLHSPMGDSIRIWDGESGAGTKDHIITVFDDQADTIFSPEYIEFGPRVRLPVGTLNSVFAGKNAKGNWRLKITDNVAASSGYLYSWGIQVNNNVLVGVESESEAELPSNYKLRQNYPNPFNPVTNITFSIPSKNIVKLKVFDMLGKEIAVLINKEMNAGSYDIDFNGSKLSSGIYFYKLEAGAFTDVKKMTLIK
jgi:subtilisin-like proprotein convertase family protein